MIVGFDRLVFEDGVRGQGGGVRGTGSGGWGHSGSGQAGG